MKKDIKVHTSKTSSSSASCCWSRRVEAGCWSVGLVLLVIVPSSSCTAEVCPPAFFYGSSSSSSSRSCCRHCCCVVLVGLGASDLLPGAASLTRAVTLALLRLTSASNPPTLFLLPPSKTRHRTLPWLFLNFFAFSLRSVRVLIRHLSLHWSSRDN